MECAEYSVRVHKANRSPFRRYVSDTSIAECEPLVGVRAALVRDSEALCRSDAVVVLDDERSPLIDLFVSTLMQRAANNLIVRTLGVGTRRLCKRTSLWRSTNSDDVLASTGFVRFIVDHDVHAIQDGARIIVVDVPTALKVVGDVLAAAAAKPFLQTPQAFYRASVAMSARPASSAEPFSCAALRTIEAESWAEAAYNRVAVTRHRDTVEEWQQRRLVAAFDGDSDGSTSDDESGDADDGCSMTEQTLDADDGAAWLGRDGKSRRVQRVHSPHVYIDAEHVRLPAGTPLTPAHERHLLARMVLAADVLGSLETLRCSAAIAAASPTVHTGMLSEALACSRERRRLTSPLQMSASDLLAAFDAKCSIEQCYFDASVAAGVALFEDDDNNSRLWRARADAKGDVDELAAMLPIVGVRKFIVKALRRSAHLFAAILSAPRTASRAELAETACAAAGGCRRARLLVDDLSGVRLTLARYHAVPRRECPRLLKCLVKNDRGALVAKQATSAAQRRIVAQVCRRHGAENMLSVTVTDAETRPPTVDEIVSSLRAAVPELRCGHDYALVYAIDAPTHWHLAVSRLHWRALALGHIAFVCARYPRVSTMRARPTANFVAALLEYATSPQLVALALRAAGSLLSVRGTSTSMFADTDAPAAVRRVNMLVQMLAPTRRHLVELLDEALDHGAAHRLWNALALALTPHAASVSLLVRSTGVARARELNSAYPLDVRALYETFFVRASSKRAESDALKRAHTANESVCAPTPYQIKVGPDYSDARYAISAEHATAWRNRVAVAFADATSDNPPRSLKNAAFRAYGVRSKPIVYAQQTLFTLPTSNGTEHLRLLDTALLLNDAKNMLRLRVCATAIGDPTLFCVPLSARVPAAYCPDEVKTRLRDTRAKLKRPRTDEPVADDDDDIPVTLALLLRTLDALAIERRAGVMKRGRGDPPVEMARRSAIVARTLARLDTATVTTSIDAMATSLAVYRADVVPSTSESRSAQQSANVRRLLYVRKERFFARPFVDARPLLITGALTNYFWSFERLRNLV